MIFMILHIQPLVSCLYLREGGGAGCEVIVFFFFFLV